MADLMFQSTPGFSAGRNLVGVALRQVVRVVSIHSRLFGREKRMQDVAVAPLPRFNPLPAFRPGETILSPSMV